MQTGGAQALGKRVKVTIDHIGGEHVSGVRIRVAEEVGETDGWKWIFILEGVLIELHHRRERWAY